MPVDTNKPVFVRKVGMPCEGVVQDVKSYSPDSGKTEYWSLNFIPYGSAVALKVSLPAGFDLTKLQIDEKIKLNLCASADQNKGGHIKFTLQP